MTCNAHNKKANLKIGLSKVKISTLALDNILFFYMEIIIKRNLS